MNKTVTSSATLKHVLKKKEKKKKKKIPIKMFSGDTSVPDQIVIFYNKKIDFDRIDKVIQHKYNVLKELIPEKEKEIESRNRDIKKQTECSKIKNHEKEIKNLKKEIEDYRNDVSLNEYISSTRKILEDLLGDYGSDEELIEKYFSICRKYIQIDFIRDSQEAGKCKNCGEKIEESIQPDDIQPCPYCDCLNSVMRPTKYVRDIEYGNTVYDEDIINFIKVLDKFEGKNTTQIHSKLYEELDEYMENINMKKGEYYRGLPLTKDGEKEGTSKKILWQALESLGYNQYYEEASYLCHVYWGWSLPDLSSYRDKMIEIYQSTQTVWHRIKKDFDRSASLGTQYRLYVQLCALDYPYCKKENFRIQEMVDSLRLHNRAWTRMCQETGVKCCLISS